MSEERAKSKTGGEKGRKPEAYSLVPIKPLASVARVYEYGSRKYAPHNWLKGYPWSWATDALFRHIEAWRGGERLDPETGLPHLAHAVFHLFSLMEFEERGIGEDDRGFKTGP